MLIPFRQGSFAGKHAWWGMNSNVIQGSSPLTSSTKRASEIGFET
jgi:hypothetical protein